MSQYQTVPLPDGSVQVGLFPTIDWFQKIMCLVDFSNARVLDLGCCQFSYGIQALHQGAKEVIGVDHDRDRVLESRRNIQLWRMEHRAAVIPVDALDYI